MKLLFKNDKGEVVDELDGETATPDDLKKLIDAPWEDNRNREVYIFLKSRVNDKVDELPYKKLKYDHDIKMSWVISLIQNNTISLAKKVLMIYSKLDKFERSYKKSIINFSDRDMAELYRDWLADGITSAYNVKRNIEYIYDLIDFCKKKNEEHQNNLNLKIFINDRINPTIFQLQVPVLKYKKFLDFLGNEKYSIDARLILYFMFKGAQLKVNSDELSNIRFNDIDFHNRIINIKGFKGNKFLPIFDEELHFLRLVLIAKKHEIEQISNKYNIYCPPEKYYIFLKQRKLSEGITPISPAVLRHRFTQDLVNLSPKEDRKFLGYKSITYSGFANEFKHKLNEGETSTDAIFKTMYQFSMIDNKILDDYTKVNPTLYTKVKFNLKSYL